MKLRQLVLKTAPIIALIATAGSASADLCRDLLRVQTDNQVFIDAIAQGHRTSLSNSDTRRLAILIISAHELEEYNLNSPALDRAVSTYVGHVDALRDARYAGNDILVVRLAKSAGLNTAIKALSDAGRTYCRGDADTDTAQSPDRNSGRGPLASMSWQTVVPISLTAMFAIGAAMFFSMRFHTIQKLRSQRFNCNVTVTIASASQTFQTTMIDISAKGAKIRKPAGAEVSDSATMIVDGVPFAFKKAWENAHYTGALFDKPMRIRQVRAWAGARQTKKVEKTEDHLA